jgi:hypothetical protein
MEDILLACLAPNFKVRGCMLLLHLTSWATFLTSRAQPRLALKDVGRVKTGARIWGHGQFQI